MDEEYLGYENLGTREDKFCIEWLRSEDFRMVLRRWGELEGNRGPTLREVQVNNIAVELASTTKESLRAVQCNGRR